MSNALKQWLDRQPPEKRRKIMVGGIIGGLVLVSSAVILSNPTPPKRVGSAKKEQSTNLLMGTSGREMGLAGEAKTNAEQAEQLAALREELERLKRGDGAGGAAPVGSTAPEAINGPPGTVFSTDRPSTTPDFTLPPSARPGSVPQLPDIPTGPANSAVPPPAPPPPPVAPTINTYRDETPRTSAAVRKLKQVYLPTGTMMSGVLLNGLDAPTGRGAQGAPIPVLVRVKHEAILPSLYRSDVREAFILAAGFGDLSSERAYLRAEKFSMILRNGEVIDIPIKMSAVGHDGKTGLRGRVVSKQGTVIAKAMLSGTADGISRAFGGSRSTGSRGGMPTDQELAAAAIEGGATSALDRVTDYFLQQADAMHPVVEVDAGRDVTFVVLEGSELTPRSAEEEPETPAPEKPAKANATASR